MVSLSQIATPGLFGVNATPGFTMPNHIRYLDSKLCDAISRRGSKRLLVSMPPRHGKSEYISKHLPAWFRGIYPRKEAVITTYGANFSASWGRKSKHLLAKNQDMFGVQVDMQSPVASWRIKGSEQVTFCSGVGGELTGKGAHLLVVDDPIKNAKESKSQTMRDATWDWWQSTAFSRIEPGGIAIILMTRWNEDDLVGRIKKQMLSDPDSEQWEIISFPAICDTNDDILGRKRGEALWPERYNEETLLKIQKGSGAYWWSALYQQQPAPLEGGLFQRSWFVEETFDITRIGDRVRAWDFAATENDGDWTVGLLMGKHLDSGDYWILDVVRGQWAPWKRDEIIRKTAIRDGEKTRIITEQEPGSAGKSFVAAMKRMLDGFSVKSYRPSGSKELRAEPLSTQAGIGRLRVPKNAQWLDGLIHEYCIFPNGSHDDQVDAGSMAFNSMHKKGRVLVA